MTINIDDYGKFVRGTTSDESLRTEVMADRLFGLQNTYKDAEWSQLITCSMGMQAESGEFSEIIKKIVFQGKHYDEDIRFHLKRELGDVLWYWVQGCLALGFTPQEVMKENITKLEKRYPNGFDYYRSENRDKGDI